MASMTKTIIKIVFFLVINGAILGEIEATAKSYPSSKAPAPSEGDKCYKNLSGECKKSLLDALCQERSAPFERMVSDPCCEELRTNVNSKCFTNTMVNDAKKKCKLSKSLMKTRSTQIWSFCTDLDTPSLSELVY